MGNPLPFLRVGVPKLAAEIIGCNRSSKPHSDRHQLQELASSSFFLNRFQQCQDAFLCKDSSTVRSDTVC
jgi:hypothetical protein